MQHDHVTVRTRSPLQIYRQVRAVQTCVRSSSVSLYEDLLLTQNLYMWQLP